MKMKDLALAQVRRGERFTLDGVEFVKLEDDMDAAFAVAADTLPECCQFEDDDAEREDHNNYAGSLLSKTVERWLRDKHPAIFSAVVERPIDLTTMDGMTDYGKPLAVARALTIDEYRKHRSVLPLTSKPYWLATGWTTNSSPYSSWLHRVLHLRRRHRGQRQRVPRLLRAASRFVSEILYPCIG